MVVVGTNEIVDDVGNPSEPVYCIHIRN